MAGRAGKKNRSTALLEKNDKPGTPARQGESMSRIRILDAQVAAQVAAGEVITRPAAVVKELVENALDAGARAITVEIEEGGVKIIRVVDDGCGMTPEEAPLSLKRHATSKLRAETDLLSMATLGFRGEALPSIAAVSRLTLVSAAADAAPGCRLVVQAGEVLESSLWAAPRGTQVTVAELFFNTPARRKFLKSAQSEQGYIVEIMRHLALAYPEVHFTVKTPARTLLAAPAAQDLAARVAALYTPELAGRMLPLAQGLDRWAVTGLVTDPDYTLATSRAQVFLVNRRVVQDRILGAVLKGVFTGLLPRGRHPAAVLNLRLPAGEVDVNVHPAKTEVRFREPGRVYALLAGALRQALGSLAGSGPTLQVNWQPEAAPRVAENTLPGFAAQSAPQPQPPGFSLPACYPPASALTPAAASRGCRFQDLTVIGCLQETYILAQGPEGLVLIDQHAAHERILYERLRAAPPGAGGSQTLLFPVVVELPPVQADWVRDHLDALAAAGMVLESFGGASFLVTAAPACLADADLEALVAEAVEAMAPMKGLNQPQEVRERALLFMACRGAIKAGDALQPEEIQALLQDLDAIPVSSHCPHGRPLWRLISFDEIRQSFKR
jgi:DNA mismatch repair protein MutL